MNMPNNIHESPHPFAIGRASPAKPLGRNSQMLNKLGGQPIK